MTHTLSHDEIKELIRNRLAQGYSDQDIRRELAVLQVSDTEVTAIFNRLTDHDSSESTQETAKTAYAAAYYDSSEPGQETVKTAYAAAYYDMPVGSRVSQADETNANLAHLSHKPNRLKLLDILKSDVVFGFVIMMLGIGLTLSTYSAAANNPEGGEYILAWGAILVGFIRMSMGLMRY